MHNVCFFNTVKFWGGGEKLHLEYARAFREKGYRVTVLAGRKSVLSSKARALGLETYEYDVHNLSFLNPFKVWTLSRFFIRHHIDTVIFTTSQDVKTGCLAASLSRLRNRVYLRGLAVPVKNSMLNRLLYGRLLTHIIANSEETKRQMVSRIDRREIREKIRVIYHGIELPQQEGPSEQKSADRSEVIILGNAGRLTEQKGQQLLLQVARILKDESIKFRLLIAGEGELKNPLQESINRMGLEKHVILQGFVEDMPAWMNSIDIFLLSSVWEGFGFVLVEAMARSKPIVAWDVSSNPEIVAEGNTGFLIPYPDTGAFAEKLLMLIRDEDLRRKMGEAGRKHVTNRFLSAERITEFEQYIMERVEK